jgi:hypothetical protein
MKKLFVVLIFAFLACIANAQVSARHFFESITPADVASANSLKTVNKANFSLSWFLRGKISETAWEIPLFKGGGGSGQWFKATGIGLSLAAYDLNAVEKFSVDAILYAPNTDANVNGVSTALAIGIPVPKLNLPFNINVGIREDWKAKAAYLQTNITYEF